MRLILLFFLTSTACSVTTYGDPKDPPTEQELVVISEMLTDMEQRFQALGYEVNFREIPIFVVDDPTYVGTDIAGLCRGSGSRIILDRRLFNVENEEGKISMLWWTILHEFGHCYFFRDHDENYIRADKSKIFYFETLQDIPKKDRYVYKIQASIMFPGLTRVSKMMPEAAKDYYISEMVNHMNKETFSGLGFKDMDMHIDLEKAFDQGYSSNGDCSE